jgi:Zn-dependent peptidase ImmA (M78 family)
MKRYEHFLGQKIQAYDFIDILEKEGHNVSIPIDIENLIKEYLEIKCEVKPDFKNMKVTGSISVQNGEPYIWVNPMKNTSKERKRFTLAHELGHFMLHMAPANDLNNFDSITDTVISFNRDDNWDYTEMEANNFAAQLLMPKLSIKKHIKIIIDEHSNISKESLVEQLADLFQVSETAMKFRLTKLGVKGLIS